MEDLCLSVRTIHRCANSTEPAEEWMESLPDILETAEESVVNGLTDILSNKMKNGLQKESARDIQRKTAELVGAGPIGRVNHDVFGILDLIQQNLQTIESGKLVGKVIEVSLLVAGQSPYKYLRCKAFEVLAELNSRPNLGEFPAGMRVEEMLHKSDWPNAKLQKVTDQWNVMRRRALDSDIYFQKLRSKSFDYQPISTESRTGRGLSPLLPAGRRSSSTRLEHSTPPIRAPSTPVSSMSGPSQGSEDDTLIWETESVWESEARERDVLRSAVRETEVPRTEIRATPQRVGRFGVPISEGGNRRTGSISSTSSQIMLEPQTPSSLYSPIFARPQPVRGTTTSTSRSHQQLQPLPEIQLDMVPPRGPSLSHLEPQPSPPVSVPHSVGQGTPGYIPSTATDLTRQGNSSQDTRGSGDTQIPSAIHTTPPSQVSLPIQTNPLNRLHVQAVTRQYPGKRRTQHQATAISATCQTIALINKSDFQIFSVPKSANEVPTLKSEAKNTGVFRSPPDTWTKDFNQDGKRDFQPQYMRAAMSDDILCISCDQNCIDLHETLTARRLTTFQFPRNALCRTLILSPDGKKLAVGTGNGDVLLYNVETVGERDSTVSPTLIKSNVLGKSISCIAFSANSIYLSFCHTTNDIYTYHVHEETPIFISKYSRGLAENSCRSPYFGVTSLSLYSPFAFCF